MRSRWRDFLTTDGEKPDRHRDTEFETPPATRAELMEMWECGWKYVFDALEPLTRIRPDTNGDDPLRAALRDASHQPPNRALRHHVGQILFLAKHFAFTRKGKWESLSVPRGKSAEINVKTAAGELSAQETLFSSKKD